MTSFEESFVVGGPGTYQNPAPSILATSTTYYWQVIPTTDARSGSSNTREALLGSSSQEQRSDANNCPIWSFTTADALPITVFPYLQSFEAGAAGWSSGAVTGNNHWQLGSPAQTQINHSYGGANAWMTYLDANYENNANTWLKSPPFNFSSLNAPNFSVWLNIYCESGYDGMILESSVDAGASWQYVSGDAGFYNNNLAYAPISVPKWSGMIGNWVQYSSSLAGLETRPWFICASVLLQISRFFQKVSRSMTSVSGTWKSLLQLRILPYRQIMQLVCPLTPNWAGHIPPHQVNLILLPMP